MRFLLAVLTLVVVGAGIFWFTLQPTLEEPAPVATESRDGPLRVFSSSDQMITWWGRLPEPVAQNAYPTGNQSNVHPGDYSGPEACRQCHEKNYARWSEHPHRWMNALADDESIRGDFESDSSINYMGGIARFNRDGDRRLMHLSRDDVSRSYEVTQTIGSRFFQYFVGRQTSGPEEPEHVFYSTDHVLPFGYWLSREEWIPIVHVQGEAPDDERYDPFEPTTVKGEFAVYSANCSNCHTTFPLGDLFTNNTNIVGRYSPVKLHWFVSAYVQETHPDLLLSKAPSSYSEGDERAIFDKMRRLTASGHAVSFGVSCEACHLGSEQHAKNPKIKPDFFPRSPHLLTEEQTDFGRSAQNVNWACGRCHVGDRPDYAAHISTWNSVEYSDAMLGGCYSQLTCIHCHNPHAAIGPAWKNSVQQDDALCLSCHKEYEQAEPRAQHTHHALSAGVSCMDCHMPRINEGLEHVVRTHSIYSPTNHEMIENNHPNACNLCHTQEPIDWTLKHLGEWYGTGYADILIEEAYPHRDQSVAVGWSQSDDEHVRLVGIDALTRAGNGDSLPQIIQALDDPFLLNRQFARIGLERMLNIELADQGYRYYMSRDERSGPLEKIRDSLLKNGED